MRRSRPKKRRSWRCKVADDLLAQIRLNGAVPRHVAIIMDGNGRWARERNLPRPFGHRAGMKAVREVVEGAIERSEEHTSELQSRLHLVCRLLLEKKKKK